MIDGAIAAEKAYFGLEELNMPTKTVSIPRHKIAEFCNRHRIRKLSLFGSATRDDFRPDSDVDLLVEFEPQAKVGFFKLYDLEQELSSLLDGRRIDINTPNSLSKYFRDEVLREAEVHYVAA
jgi:predicted nucleotidyltransferase